MGIYDEWKNSFNTSLFQATQLSVAKLFKQIDEKSNSTENIDTVMFISFDIVNSSLYKSSNYSGWFKVIYSLLNYVYRTIVKDIKDIKLWRTIGDELVFVVSIYDIKDLEVYTQKVFEALVEINRYIKSGEIFENKDNRDDLIENNILEVKSTAWIAMVSEIKSANDLNKTINGNIRYLYDKKIDIVDIKTNNGDKFIEYQGKDIDLGFRIAKNNTVARKFALSTELAYILSQSDNINPKLHIVGYNSLKGVWNNRPYPIIWYHDEYIAGCKIEDSFTYDEDDNDDDNNIVYNYLNRHNSDKIRDKSFGNTRLELTKVISDRNLLKKINRIEKSLKEGRSKKEDIIDRADENLEVHCVAVCINQNKDKVLMFKRSNNCEIFKGLWDFGCVKMLRGWTFKENLKKEYKQFSNLDIEVKNPFADYYFENKEAEIIPGIRYKAYVNDDYSIDLNKQKYVEYKWLDLKEFERMEKESQTSPFVAYDEFREVIKEILDEG